MDKGGDGKLSFYIPASGNKRVHDDKSVLLKEA